MSFLQKRSRCLKKLYLYIYFAPLYCNKQTMHIFFLFKKTKHICFHDTNNVTNIISYNINSYLFERHQKYGILITEFVIEYN